MPATTRETDQTATPRDYRSRYEELTGKSLHRCPSCHEGCMRLIESLPGGDKLAVIDTS